MPSLRESLLRDPLIHFLVLGALLLGVQQLRGVPEPDTETVQIGPAIEEALRAELTAQLGRPPSPQELQDRRQRWLTDEVLYREALRIGLDRGDPIVRRRLVQRMRFVLEDLAGVPELDDEALQARMDANPERYQRESLYSLEHVFLNADVRTDLAGALAQTRQSLEAGADPSSLGDPFPQGRRFEARPAGTFARIFGERFASELPSPSDGWVERGSAGGAHWVRVTEVVPGRPLTLAEARDQVRRDALGEAQQQEVQRRVEVLVRQWTAP